MNLHCFRIPATFITLFFSAQTCFNAYVAVIPNVFCKPNLCFYMPLVSVFWTCLLPQQKHMPSNEMNGHAEDADDTNISIETCLS
jgi:hypothetical protein